MPADTNFAIGCFVSLTDFVQHLISHDSGSTNHLFIMNIHSASFKLATLLVHISMSHHTIPINSFDFVKNLERRVSLCKKKLAYAPHLVAGRVGIETLILTQHYTTVFSWLIQTSVRSTVNILLLNAVMPNLSKKSLWVSEVPYSYFLDVSYTCLQTLDYLPHPLFSFKAYLVKFFYKRFCIVKPLPYFEQIRILL